MTRPPIFDPKFWQWLPSLTEAPIPYLFVAVGIFLVLSAIFNWRRVTQPQALPQRDAFRRLVYLKGGRCGYRLYLVLLGLGVLVLAYFWLRLYAPKTTETDPILLGTLDTFWEGIRGMEPLSFPVMSLLFGFVFVLAAIFNWELFISPSSSLLNRSLLAKFFYDHWGNTPFRILSGLIGLFLIGVGFYSTIIKGYP